MSAVCPKQPWELLLDANIMCHGITQANSVCVKIRVIRDTSAQIKMQMRPQTEVNYIVQILFNNEYDVEREKEIENRGERASRR